MSTTDEPPSDSPSIEPGRCPGGVIVRVYAVPSGVLVIEQALRPGDDIEGAATLAAEQAPSATCLVAYDGDTGQRYPGTSWLGLVP